MMKYISSMIEVPILQKPVSPLIYRTSQLTGFYMIRISVMKELTVPLD